MSNINEKILITGCAGFIGSHVSEYLLKNNKIIYGIDNLNDYYDVKIKLSNLDILKKSDNFTFKKDDICTTNVIEEFKPDKIIHLASMAGVRYSIENPYAYAQSNLIGFLNIIELCSHNDV